MLGSLGTILQMQKGAGFLEGEDVLGCVFFFLTHPPPWTKPQEDRESAPRPGRLPRCIILAPTRELAKQVEREFQDSAPGLAVGCFYGGARRVMTCHMSIMACWTVKAGAHVAHGFIFQVTSTPQAIGSPGGLW